MSYDDEYSDASFDDSSASGVDEPPTLDETLFDISLFKLFMAYMKSQQAAPDLQFLKQARLLRLYNVPRPVFAQQAVKVIWTYFCDCATMPVSASPETKAKLVEMALDADKEATIDRDTFAVAFGEVYNNVVPHFRNWIATNEWRDAIPFHRLAPPSFNVVLTSGTLRVLFNKFIKNLVDRQKSETVKHAYHLWKFCIIANDFRDGKYNHASHLDSKTKKGEAAGEGTKSETSEISVMKTEDPDKDKANPEEYAKRLYKKYKHQVSLPYDGSIPYAVYIIRALDHAIEEFEKSALFAQWTALKQYHGVDYQAKVVHQTLTADGFVESPSVAAAMASSMLPFFLVMMAGTENGLALEFMVDAVKFHREFKSFEKSATPMSPRGTTSQVQTSSVGSTSTDTNRKDMVDEARRIFAKYLDSGDLYVDPTLVEEVRTALTKSSGKGVTPSLFRKCGAFTYQRAEHSWGREARATIAWTNKSYENRSKATRAIEEEFAMNVLPENFDLQLVPNIDDVLNCPELAADFGEFCGPQVASAFASWQAAYGEYFQAPVHARKPILLKIIKAFSECAACYPHLQPLQDFIEKEWPKREHVPDSAIMWCTAAGLRATAQKYLLRWLVEHNMKWKSADWAPVTNIQFSDMTLAFGMAQIERQIEEEAVKGKSGFSKFLAKRQVKKQSVANVRTSHATATSGLAGPSKDIFATGTAMELMKFGKDFGKAGGAKEWEDMTAANYTPTAPSIDDTLCSPYLRRFFSDVYLGTVLPSTEIALWDALTAFYSKYTHMECEKLDEAQSEMRKDITEICEKYHAILDKKADALKDKLEHQKTIYPQFFRSVEKELYGERHTAFEKTLREKGWK